MARAIAKEVNMKQEGDECEQRVRESQERCFVGSERESVGVAGEVRQAHNSVLVPSQLLRLLLALQIPTLRFARV